MAEAALKELASLEKYLGLKKTNKYSTKGERKVPVLQTKDGQDIVGLVTIACHLVKAAKQEQLLGRTREESAVVQQWLEYRIVQLGAPGAKEESRSTLRDLNEYLEDKVYFGGDFLSLADILMYYGLHSCMVDLTVQDREKFVNVSRWFSHIQQLPNVQQHLPRVHIMKNRIYTNVH
uniref:Eukaryotic translation elongation factor 1 epsilon 1 n=1 Tax=Erpetoichthys calabaricus TaxID=27687 RepID=A0A8C4T537_ERPCA